jgi:hypothetical protein
LEVVTRVRPIWLAVMFASIPWLSSLGSIDQGSPFRAASVAVAALLVFAIYTRVSGLFRPFGYLRWLDAPDDWTVAILLGLLKDRSLIIIATIAGWVVQVTLVIVEVA